MTRKKRKTGKHPVKLPRSPQFSGKQPPWLLPLLGALALVLSWLAALGGVSDGTVDWRYMVDKDALRSFSVFRDAFLDDGYPASGWLHGRAPFYFPDFAMQWALFALGVDLRVVVYLFPLLQVGLAAVGWIFACDFLFGKSPARRAAVLLLHAAAFLLLAWRETHLFFPLFAPGWHWGAWMCVPWLLLFSLPILSNNGNLPFSRGNITALVVVLAAVAASDILIVLWFAAPVIAAAFFSARFRAVFVLASACGVGIALGILVHHVFGADTPDVPTSAASPERVARALHIVLQVMRDVTSPHPSDIAVMAAFAGALVWRLVVALPARKKAGRKAFCPQLFVPLFIIASVGLAPVVMVLLGVAPNNSYDANPIRELRYMLPFFYFPLFAGWALLAGRVPRASTLAAAGCAVVAAFSAPKAAKIDLAAMNPFGTSFQKCFAENARRLGWQGGVSGSPLVLTHNPEAGVKRYINAYVHWGGAPNQSFVAANPYLANWRRFSGEFQFVLVNGHNGRVFRFPPRDIDRGCDISRHAPCTSPHGPGHILDDHAARGAFGEPAEIVECAGLAFYHYDPPLRFEFSERPESPRPIGRKF